MKKFFYALIVCLLLGFLLLKYVFLFGNTVSSSMEPTMNVGDIAIAYRLSYLFSLPKRGDIISFYHDDPQLLYEKRVIGLPGDSISFKDGFVFINDRIIKEEYLDENVETNCTKTFNVPDGYVFVMGDNRENSIDSRYWTEPYVSFNDIEAKHIVNLSSLLSYFKGDLEYEQINSVPRISFLIPKNLMKATAVCRIAQNTVFSAKNTYIYKDGIDKFIVFKPGSFIIFVEKGTHFRFSPNIPSKEKAEKIYDTSVTGMHFSLDADNFVYTDEVTNGVYKIVAEVNGCTDIAPRGYQDFCGKLAVISDGTTEISLFAGLDDTNRDVDKYLTNEMIDTIIDSLAMTYIEPKDISSNSQEYLDGNTVSFFDQNDGILLYNQKNPIKIDHNYFLSSIYSALSIGDTGIFYAFGDDASTQTAKITLTNIYDDFDVSKIHNDYYSKAPKGTHFEAVEYTVDTVGVTSTIYANIKFTGLDGKQLWFNDKSYPTRTFVIDDNVSINGNVSRGYIAYYIVPDGCKEYFIVCGDITEEMPIGPSNAYYYIKH